jgi:16S rRNA A1518/A1519 N6-dimethyltransferase RsmA/KsgA/DIM1 with predicted DNA glycosylase/AP lyase activity
VPKVDAAMLRIDASPDKRSRLGDIAWFAGVVRRLFAHRRKTLRHNLLADYGREVLESLQSADRLDLTRRPETLSGEEWLYLSSHIARLVS